MKKYFNHKFPSSEYLQKKASTKIPKFAFEYMENGANDEICLRENIKDISRIKLIANQLDKSYIPDKKVKIFGKQYDSPFGIAPVGLRGLMWPKADEILAKAAKNANIPFILSGVSTASLEKIADIAEENAWYNLYIPSNNKIRDNLLERIKQNG